MTGIMNETREFFVLVGIVTITIVVLVITRKVIRIFSEICEYDKRITELELELIECKKALRSSADRQEKELGEFRAYVETKMYDALKAMHLLNVRVKEIDERAGGEQK